MDTERIDHEDRSVVVVYTDGSCYPNPNGSGGWAFYCTYRGKSAVRYGFSSSSTNNAMELTAILHALRYVPKDEAAPLVIFTDSQYCKNAITLWVEEWKFAKWKTANGGEVKNKKLIAEIDKLMTAHREVRRVELRWVRGHSGIPENELVDQTAGMARVNAKTNWKPSDHRNRVTRK